MKLVKIPPWMDFFNKDLNYVHHDVGSLSLLSRGKKKEKKK